MLESDANPASLASDDIVATGFDSQSGEHPFDQGWQNVTIPLSGRAGDTLVFRVATANTISCMPVWLDAAKGSNDQRAGFCSVLGNTTPDETAIPARNVPGPRCEPAGNGWAVQGCDAAFYYQDKGISCDNLPGYTKTGELVGYGGHGDPGGYTYMAKN